MTSLSIFSADSVTEFEKTLSFPLDRFQREACGQLSQGKGVLVCAPTGAGKTVVGQFAIFLANSAGCKCFYTTPIKALSNQKYDELCLKLGYDKVGLLTGDNSINATAPVVVMTTEVLRNMIYDNSSVLLNLSHVVMDEVHYLADRFRGGVWEEVILGLPEHVRVVGLSATVSNAEEFGAWIQQARGATAIILDETRPVPLYQHILVGSRIYPVYDNGNINREVVDAINKAERAYLQLVTARNDSRPPQRGSGARNRKSAIKEQPEFTRNRRALPATENLMDAVSLDRPEIVHILSQEQLLPVIYFIFSRAGCDQAVQSCLNAKLHLQPVGIREKIDQIIEKHVLHLDAEDLEIIGFQAWRGGLYRGFAAHHAGILPAFRRAVEELYTSGLLKVVFATETLALGINMPAKSVFIEKLVKFNGEQTIAISPGEFTQLTGRAGRRGIDIEGHAIVKWQPGMQAGEIAFLASTRTFPLTSSFMPMYNMSLNLLQKMGLTKALELIGSSFAQYQADMRTAHTLTPRAQSSATQTKIAEIDHAIVAILAENDPAVSHDNPYSSAEIEEYITVIERIHYLEKEQEKERKKLKKNQLSHTIDLLRKGEIIAIYQGRKTENVAIMHSWFGGAKVINSAGKAAVISANDVAHNAQVVGSIDPALFKLLKSGKGIAILRQELKKNRVKPAARSKNHSDNSKFDGLDPIDHQIAELRAQLDLIPIAQAIHTAPNRSAIAALIHKRKLLTEHKAAKESQNSFKSHTHSLTRIFSRIITILSELGYIRQSQHAQEESSHELELTDSGHMLLKLYSESDLLIAQCLEAGIWDNLNSVELAAVVSTMVFESRGDRKTKLYQLYHLTPQASYALEQTIRLWEKLANNEVEHGLKPTREPDLGFVAAMWDWASWGSLEHALQLASDRGKPQSAGDFVRWTRQVVDLLQQIAQVKVDTPLGRAAGQALSAMKRGIVTAGMIG